MNFLLVEVMGCSLTGEGLLTFFFTWLRRKDLGVPIVLCSESKSGVVRHKKFQLSLCVHLIWKLLLHFSALAMNIKTENSFGNFTSSILTLLKLQAVKLSPALKPLSVIFNSEVKLY